MPTTPLTRKTLAAVHGLVVDALIARGRRHKATADPLDVPYAPREEKALYVPIVRRDAVEQKVWGIVLAPDVEDEDGHTVDADEIERVAHRFMEMSRAIDVEHGGVYPDIVPVESFIVRAPGYVLNGVEVPVGAWVLASHIKSPEIWARVESGELCGYSLKMFAQIEED